MTPRLVIGPLVEGPLGWLDARLANVTRRVASTSPLGVFRRLVYVTEPIIDGTRRRHPVGEAVVKVSSHYRAWARALVEDDAVMSDVYRATRRLHVRYVGATLLHTDFGVRLARHRADVDAERTNRNEQRRFAGPSDEVFVGWHAELDRLLTAAVPQVQRLDSSGDAPEILAARVVAHALACWELDGTERTRCRL